MEWMDFHAPNYTANVKFPEEKSVFITDSKRAAWLGGLSTRPAIARFGGIPRPTKPLA
jgi:hypothetical protein